ncbi:MAG: hypothetical protein WC455_24195 [Dehalococcoidia bacterium]|jgi:hypothetical protein
MKTEKNIINGFDFSALPIKVTYVGKVQDKDWPHFLWNVVITQKDGFWTVPYKTGLGLVKKKPCLGVAVPSEPVPTTPTTADIMHSLLLDADAADQSFNEWCDNYGYDTDSMKAFKTYQTCCEEAVNLKKTFTREQLADMQKALEDY